MYVCMYVWLVENTGTRYTGTDIRVSGTRIYGYTDIRIYGYTDIRVYGYKISIFSKYRLIVFYNLYLTNINVSSKHKPHFFSFLIPMKCVFSETEEQAIM